MTAMPNWSELAPPSRAQPMLIPRAQYERMDELGLFAGKRVELVYGVIIEMNSMGPKHWNAIRALTRFFVPAVFTTHDVLVQMPGAVSEYSSPEPDFAFVPHGVPREKIKVYPLVIEVSDSTLKFDLGTKAQLYAELAVPEYWVIDLQHRVTVVHTAVRRGKYGRKKTVPWSSPLASAQVSGLTVKLSELL